MFIVKPRYSDETLETSAFLPFTVANLRFNLGVNTKLPTKTLNLLPNLY